VAALKVILSGGGTGGHLYPALNIADAMLRAQPGLQVMFLGAERGVEARVLPGTGHPFQLLPLQPLYRSRPWRNWRLLATAPQVTGGLVGAFRRFDPGLVVGTGGYVSGPAVLLGHLTGRRTAIQEQNARPGLVTRMLAPRVDQIHLGYPEAERGLKRGQRTQVFAYGNPVARPAETASGPLPGAFDWPTGRVLLIAGGSQGARGLNHGLLEDLERASHATDGGPAAAAAPGPSAREGPGDPSSAVAPSIFSRSAWPVDLSIVWVTGPAHLTEVSDRVKQLPWADRIRVVPFIEGLGAQLSGVCLAICRAGAMFVSELAAAGVPAIFVPFPAAAGGHQTANATAMVEAGAAAMREEEDLQPGDLLSLATRLLTDEPARLRMAGAMRARGARDAADRIAKELLDLLSSQGNGTR
jgi:UDP-N-acetylglucosamine--N-acetylmuramyl-(pentapeptide) pyrophosphoryl-undecaprenol N-acetylglucosamine transferase